MLINIADVFSVIDEAESPWEHVSSQRRHAIAMSSPAAVAGMIQLTDYEEINEVLKSRKFVQGSQALVRDTLMKDVLFMLDGEEHLARKRILTRLLDDDAVAAYRDRHLLPVVERCLAEEAAAHRGTDGVVRSDLAPLIQVCVHRVAAALAGIDGLESLDAALRFMEQMRVITAGKTVDWSLEDKDRVVAAAYAAYDAFRREFFEPSHARRKEIVVHARAQGRNPAADAADMLSLMAAHREDTWKGDDGLVMREINSFITGSTQSTANAFVSFTLRLERWFEQHPADRGLVETDPEFLPRAAFESLRMGASPPARVRIAVEDIILASGRRLQAGQRVAMFLAEANTATNGAANGAMDAGLHADTAAHAAERFGEHPDAFNPRRVVAPGTAPWGITFGAGAHACPGRPLVTGSRSPTGKVASTAHWCLWRGVFMARACDSIRIARQCAIQPPTTRSISACPFCSRGCNRGTPRGLRSLRCCASPGRWNTLRRIAVTRPDSPSSPVGTPWRDRRYGCPRAIPGRRRRRGGATAARSQAQD